MTALFALLAGIATVAAPCTLPVLPILLGASVGRTNGMRPLFIVLGFVFSFAGAVILFSAVAEIVGIDQDALRGAAVVLLLMFGLLMLFPRVLDRVSIPFGGLIGRKTPVARDWSGNAGGFLLGTSLGLVWTPCAGPVLASILTVIATSQAFGQGALLLLLYAIGAAMPMLAIAYGGQFATTKLRGFARWSGALQRGFGAVIIAFALAMHFQYDTLVTAWLSSFYPDGRIGL